MCRCGTGKNQTHDDVHKYFSEQKNIGTFDHLAELGTGVFGVPDPEAGIMEVKKVLVKDLTYKETVKRGQHCLAFSFVPNGMMPFEKVTMLSCSGNCTSTTPCATVGCICGGFGCF
jgi:hypothetical protein